jgi:hypothetical protein
MAGVSKVLGALPQQTELRARPCVAPRPRLRQPVHAQSTGARQPTSTPAAPGRARDTVTEMRQPEGPPW